MADDKFDVIVAGAGPAGAAAALTLAKAGANVIVIERGTTPGSKNMMGGILYRKMLEDMVPEFWKEAPLERPIVEEQFWLTSKKSATKLGFRVGEFSSEPYNSFSVFRAHFDPWFAKKAEEAGAMLITETTVTDVIKKGDQVVGIRTDRADGDLYADVVIAADGVISQLSKKAGLQADRPFPPEHLVIGCKEVIKLPEGALEERFHLEGSNGMTIELFGDVLQDMGGFGFIYTNKDTLSLGHGLLLSDLMRTKLKPYDVLDNIKAHPSVAPFIKGGEVLEYAAKMIPEGGFNSMPRLYAGGILVTGDAAMMTNPVHREGSNLAMESGKLAGEAALHALKSKDFSASSLSRYQKLLKESFVLQDMRKYRNVPRFLSTSSDIMRVYPELFNTLAERFLSVDGTPKRVKVKQMLSEAFKMRSLPRMVKDAWTMFRTFV